MRRYIGLKLLMVSLAILTGLKWAAAQNIILNTYSGQSEITTYDGGTITLKSGFNTAGHSVHIYIKDEVQPVDNVPTALSADQNYIATWTATAPVTDASTLITKSLKDVKLAVQYFDGLGRPVQTVLKQGSLATATHASHDLVSTTVYDDFGRATESLLPYADGGTANGSYRPNAGAAQPGWYNSVSSPVDGQDEDGDNAHTLTVYEPSPLNRVLESFAPGNSWVGTAGLATEAQHRSIKQKYWINTATDAVRIWDVTTASPGSGFGSYSSIKTYPAGELYKSVTVDEENKQVIEFKDKEGQVILKKVQLTAAADQGTGSGHAGWLCTYYIYDDLGNLRCVIQPRGVELLSQTSTNWVLSSSILAEQCFRYAYDERNRMVMKQVPGAGAVYMVYDNRDRLVMTQDANMRTTHHWIATRYDNLNRPITTWLYSSSATLPSLLAAARTATGDYPTTAPTTATTLTQTHYDDYTGLTLPPGMSTTYNPGWKSYFAATSTTSFPYPEQPTQNQAITTKGLVTWTQAKVLDSTPALLLPTVNIYDDKGRVIQTQTQNITGGIDITTTQYSWAGWPLVVVQKQDEKKGTTSQVTVSVTKMTYDDLGRVVKTEQKQSNSQVKGGAMTAYAIINQVEYDALGQVEKKLLGKRRSSASAYTSTPLETQDYDYNIRGWLLGVNRGYVGTLSSTDKTASATTAQTISGEMFTESSMDIQSVTFPSTNYFGFDLGYDQKSSDPITNSAYTSARFNGNITGMTWKDAHDRKLRKYDYSYDATSRLTGASFGQLVGTSFTTTPVNYSVNNLKYDANGNILSMNQYGLKASGSSTVIDQLTYTYQAGNTSNKLAKVAGPTSTASEHLGDFQNGGNTGDDYGYDANGNMTSDLNKKISQITYNILNLPSVITVTGKGAIRYYYDATGNKLRKRTTDNTASTGKVTVTTYLGNAVYQNDTLQFFGMGEGRVRPNIAKTDWVYDYFLKDHLGNTRMMITDDYNVSSPILEANSYYPFGLQQKGIGLIASSPLHNYKNTFQKQEFNGDLGVDMYEFKYRMDDPQIGRFWQVDPLADKYVYNSTYAFSENKIISHVELEGLESTSVKEGWFLLWHPIAGSKIGSYSKGATNISTNAIRFSTRGTSASSPRSILNENKKIGEENMGSEVNGFRHTLWQATITSKYGKDIAEAAGNSHEDNSDAIDKKGYSDLANTRFKTMADADQSIDLANNQEGRNLGVDSKGMGMKDLAIKVLNKIYTTGVWTAYKDDNGDIRMGMTPITKEQYNQLMNVLKTLDNNGFTTQERDKRKKDQNGK